MSLFETIPELLLTFTVGEEWKGLDKNNFSFVALMVNGFWSLDNVANPFSMLDDKTGYLMLVPKPISWTTLLKFFLNLESGAHAYYPQIEWICVKKARFRFERQKELNFDGEMFTSDCLECQVVPQAIKLIY